MKKNKSISKLTYLILCFAFLFLALIAGILDIALKKIVVFNLSLYFVLMLLFVVFAIAFGLVYLFIKLYTEKIEKTDKENISISLDRIGINSDVKLIRAKSDDEELKEIANKINYLAISKSSLRKEKIYVGKHFLMEVQKLINAGELINFAYVRLYDINEEHVEKVMMLFTNSYAKKGNGYYDVVISYNSKEELENYLLSIAGIRARRIFVYYSDEFSISDIEEILQKGEEDGSKNLVIAHKENSKYSFEYNFQKYQNIDISKENVLEDYLRDLFGFLPYSHLGIKFGDEYYLVVNNKGKKQIHLLARSEYMYYEEIYMFTYENKKISVVVANVVEPTLTSYTNKKVQLFLDRLKTILVYEAARYDTSIADIRLNRLEELTNNLSYEVDKDYHIRFASDTLEKKYNYSLKGKLCYEALYNRKEVCPTCPIIKNVDKDTYILGSKLYQRIHFNDLESSTIYLLNKPRPYVADKLELQKRLLGLLNTTDSKGYLLCFKLDALESLAARNKTDVDEVVSEIIDILKLYELSDNLYRKEVDEFVYILEEASVNDGNNIAKAVSKAFLEKFKTQNKEISFAPKIVLLSYPLEVNTLFALDSLCRTMFRSVDKKGRLYRIDEEPLPIDNQRYYIEIVEESYKRNVIPFTFTEVKDNENKENLYYAYLDYKDNENNPILESDITLFMKLNNSYLTLVERVAKALVDLESDKKYILPIGKEALVPVLFSSLAAYMQGKKVPLDKIIFEVKEKDAYNHKEDMVKIAGYGINLSIVTKDNRFYNLETSLYRYIKVDGVKLSKDKTYQEKINGYLLKDVDIMMDTKANDVLDDVRYIDLAK